MKTVLVPLAGSESDRYALDAAGSLARCFDAHVHALHVRQSVVELGMTLTMGQGAQAGQFWDQLSRELKHNAEVARQNYDSFLRQYRFPPASASSFTSGPSAVWTEREGRLLETVIHQGLFHDFLVLTRGEKPAFIPSEIGRILMESGRPLLLVPPDPPEKICKTVCIAWKDTPQSAHALAAAMPFVARADKVIIVSVIEEQRSEDVMASLELVAGSLRWHSVEPEVRCLQTKRESASILMRDFAANAGATLLAMGGYGHSRAREFLFGGMTREIMENCEIPVLIVH